MESRTEEQRIADLQGQLTFEFAGTTSDADIPARATSATSLATSKQMKSKKTLQAVELLAKQIANRVLLDRKISMGEPTNRIGAFKVLEQWLCHVVSLNREERTFLAAAQSTDRQKSEEHGEFTFAEVSDDDRELIAEGAVFYWSIGYRVEPWGQRSTESTIRFRRLPIWTKRELSDAHKRADAQVSWFLRNGGDHKDRSTAIRD